MSLTVLDPRSPYGEVERLDLSILPTDPAACRFCIVKTMPPGSGLEAAIESVERGVGARFPEAKVEVFLRRDFMIDDAEERAALSKRADAVILVVGPSATMLHVAWIYAVGLERAGTPVVLFAVQGLEAVAQHSAVTQNARLRLVFFANPALPGPDLDLRAQAAIDTLIAPAEIAAPSEDASTSSSAAASLMVGTLEEIRTRFEALGLSDGLPIMAPTRAAVDAMLAGTSRRPTEVVCATLRPEGLSTTVETVAINAVLAGAAPAHLPVILAAVSQFGALALESMTRSVNSFAFFHMINGPLARSLEIQAGTNALGTGNPANAVIGRAIALSLRNGGGLRPGVTALPAQGNPADCTVFAENEIESPWPAFHEIEGFAPDESTVSLFAGGFCMAGGFYYRGLDDVAATMVKFESTAGALVLLTPKRARALQDAGLDREGVGDYLWKAASGSLETFRANGFFPMMKALIERSQHDGMPVLWPLDYLTRPGTDIVPLFPRSGVKLAVVGSALASLMQVWNISHFRTISITPWR